MRLRDLGLHRGINSILLTLSEATLDKRTCSTCGNYIPITIIFTDNARQLEKQWNLNSIYLEPLQNLQKGV